MALHPNFPESPYAILDPAVRWFPADEALRESSSHKLMPPLVPQLRKKVKEWRESGYVGATTTSRSLLNWWFNTQHLLPRSGAASDGGLAEFQYYFAQREALETIIYLYDLVGMQDKYDLMRFDSSGIYATKQTGGAIFCNGMKWMRRKLSNSSAMRSCVIAVAFRST